MYSAIYVVIYTYLINNSQQVLHLMSWSTTLCLIPIFYEIWIVSMVLLSSRHHQNLPDRLNQWYVAVVYKTCWIYIPPGQRTALLMITCWPYQTREKNCYWWWLAYITKPEVKNSASYALQIVSDQKREATPQITCR